MAFSACTAIARACKVSFVDSIAIQIDASCSLVDARLRGALFPMTAVLPVLPLSLLLLHAP